MLRPRLEQLRCPVWLRSAITDIGPMPKPLISLLAAGALASTAVAKPVADAGELDLAGPRREPLSQGMDFYDLAPDGRISRIVGFFGPRPTP